MAGPESFGDDEYGESEYGSGPEDSIYADPEGSGGYGSDGYGSSPYGAGGDPIIVASAVALNPNLVRVDFSDDLDFGNPLVLSPLSYVLSPTTTVNTVGPASSSSVYLTTTTLAFTPYTVTADAAITALDGAPLDPDRRSATFTGIAPGGLFLGAATAAKRVRLLFGVTLLNNSALSTPSNYTITSLRGTTLPVASVVVEPTGNSVTLVLTTAMASTEWYVAVLNPAIKSSGGLPIVPSTSEFQYVRPAVRASFAVSSFTGEANGGLIGNPLGLVFFSPALTTSAANSVIQVDDVSVCTRAYDSYAFPEFVDPTPLYTHGFGGPGGLLNSGVVLWAPAPRLSEVRTNVAASYEDEVPQAEDAMCTAVLREPWDQNYVALLNNPGWTMFDNTGTSVPPMFICADNTAPIPPGPNTIRVIHMPLTATADMTADIHATFGPTAALSGEANLTGTLT